MLKMLTCFKLSPKQNAEKAISLMCVLEPLQIVLIDHKIIAIPKAEFFQMKPSALYVHVLT